ncbi:MAG: NUDIX domain-containing protein [Candidatus Levybacteria bacterium]|nr:NUDIX domain-containing protein [Candidatus Levybacteria bacterium]
MKFEFSAGGVVFQKKGNQTLVLVAQHSGHHGWGFPKGLIGDTNKSESKEETALREVKEETGIIGEIIHTLSPQTYWYAWEGEKNKKTVYFFVMRFVSGDTTQHDFEMENVEWIDSNDVENRLTFKTDKAVWEEAKEYIFTQNA